MEKSNEGGLLTEKGSESIAEEEGIQKGAMIKSPNSLYLLKKVPSFFQGGRKEIVPLLYMPPSQLDREKNAGLNPNYHTLLDVSNMQVRHSRIYLPELEPGCRICGFSKRWMAVTKDMSIHLLNPFTRDLIKLPNRSELPVIPQNQRFTIHYNGPYYVRKVAVVDSGVNMVVGALDASGIIFFTRKTDDHWTLCNVGFFEDIITWQEDKFLGLKEDGDILVINPSSTATLFSHVQLPNWPSPYASRCYLAECSDGGLLVISRKVSVQYELGASFYTTLDFQVFKLQGGEWVRKYDLRNCLIFLGLSESRAYEVDHGNAHGENLIYFSDDNFYKYYHEGEKFIMHDSGYLNIPERKFERLRYQPYSPPSPPLWVGGPA